LVAQKSQGRPCVVSPSGAVGLMQLMPAVIDELRAADALDPAQNLAAEARRIAQLIALHSRDFTRALAAYDCDAPGREVLAGAAVPYRVRSSPRSVSAVTRFAWDGGEATWT
jgi:soluble lytic murein transglycosylase-like protein